MSLFISLLNQIACGQDLSDEQAESAVRAMMSGEVSPALSGAFLWGLKTKGDQATATTCNGRDDFVRTSGDQFTLGGKKFVFAGWNQWEVLEAASGAPPPFRHLPLPGREHIVRIMNEAVDAGLKVVRMWAHTVSVMFISISVLF